MPCPETPWALALDPCQGLKAVAVVGKEQGGRGQVLGVLGWGGGVEHTVKSRREPIPRGWSLEPRCPVKGQALLAQKLSLKKHKVKHKTSISSQESQSIEPQLNALLTGP